MADIPNINSNNTQTSTQGTFNPNFKPTIWEGAMLHNYYEISAVGLITKKAPVIHGTTAIYNQAAPVNISTTTTANPSNANVVYQKVKPKPISIEMDQIAQWGLSFTDVNLFQTNLDLLNGEMYEAAMGMDEAISTAVYADIYSKAGQTLGEITVSPLTAYDYIVDLATKLNQKKIPKVGRYVLIDSVYLGMLSKDPRFTWKPEVLAKGIVEGELISGMTIIVTEHLPALGNNSLGIFAIQKDAYGFATQFDKTQYFDKLEDSWDEAVRGRCLYGKGILRKNNIVNAQVTYNTTIQPDIVD